MPQPGPRSIRALPTPIRRLARGAVEASRRSRNRLRQRTMGAALDQAPDPGVLTPLLVDYFTRDGSTLMMRLLMTSPEIAVERPYPYETKYFSYLWRWSRLLDREDWPDDEWNQGAFGSILQESATPLMGPPPWSHRALITGGSQDDSMSRGCFELVWREFSRRATLATRIAHRQPGANVRYYAEKHLNSWRLDFDSMPSLRLLALVRDPRDTYASILAFNTKHAADLGRMNSRTEEQFIEEFIARQRERLVWIAHLPERGQIPVVRYESLIHDLPGVARRLEDWLGVTLDAGKVGRRMRRRHATTDTPESSIGRWRRDLPTDVAERLTAELAPELAAIGAES